MYIIILFVFNFIIIFILSNVKSPKNVFIDPIEQFKKPKLEKPMRLVNTGMSISDIPIDKYHPISFPINKIEKEQKDDNK